MFTLQTPATATYEEKQSKFIAHLIPYSLYKATLEHLKQEHPKARHFVTSYRYINEYDQIVENSSDDGEPKGTSGKPTLAVLQGKELVNIAVIVVRYFGGTKLGTGGLVRAYSEAVNMALASAELLEYKKLFSKCLQFSYSDTSKVEYECNRLHVEVIEKNFEADVKFVVQADEKVLGELVEVLGRTVVACP